jgi:23S rRNA (adenine2030-N6)-methyltransferase
VNYRHAFHAGNFADLVKHAALIRLLDRLTAEPSPLTVVDTHAGAGAYDLSDPAQARSKEAETGVRRLLGEPRHPPQLAALAKAVRGANEKGRIDVYPGSPALIMEALRPQDRFVAFELRPDDHADLARRLDGRGEARKADGYAGVVDVAHETEGRLAVLIDPPFERADDYARVAATVGEVLAAKPDATILVWAPLKDLETLDAFVRRLEDVEDADTTIAETRLRPLHDPMRLNGCVLAAIGAPDGFADDLETISTHVAKTLGEPGGGAKTWQAGEDA